MGTLFFVGCAPAPWTSKTLPTKVVDLKVEGLSDLDGKSKTDLEKLRQAALQREPDLKGLVPSRYKLTNRDAWDGLEDGASWNGVGGHFCGTPANQLQTFADGPSFESLTLNNPFLLARLDPHFGVAGANPRRMSEFEDSQVPQKLTLDGPARLLKIEYLHRGALPEYFYQEGAVYNLNLINARDLGFGCFAVIKKDTQGFSPIQNLAGHSFEFDKIYPLSQHYVTDSAGSAKLTNLSYNSEVVILDKMPATLKLAFWLDEKANIKEPADFSAELKVSNEQAVFQRFDLKTVRQVLRLR